MKFWRSKAASPPVGTGTPQSAPVETIMSWGAIRSPREHAVALISHLRQAGAGGRSLLQGDMEDVHTELVHELGWVHRQWPAVGRELRKLGVRKGKLWVEGQRLTVYEIPATDVVDLSERRRALPQPPVAEAR